ncbi:MAG: TorF family putative porin [Acidobacteriota bacterium]
MKLIPRPIAPLAWATVALIGSAGSLQAQAAASDEPVIQSYAIDYEAKLLTDRRTNGLSDTFLRPGAEFTVNAAHESGLIGYLQLGSVARANFPESKLWTAVAAVGYRWGNPQGWHYGVGLAQEMFPGAQVKDAPKNPFVDPTDTINTRFDTTFAVLELGYGIVEARYLNVLSKDFRGNNTAVVCGSRFGPEFEAYMGGLADPAQAMACYGDSVQHSRGSQLLSIETRYPLAHDTKLVAHVGYTEVKHFSQVTTLDYKLGVAHTRWGLDFELDAVAASMKDRSYAVTYDVYGHTKRINRTALVASIAKRF